MKGLQSIAVAGALGLTACGPAPEALDAQTVERTLLPVDALACPPSACLAPADIESPTFDVRADQLAAATRRMIDAQPRTTLLQDAAERGQLVYVQRTPQVGFPDTIWIQFIPLSDGRSSLALYSRSNYGFLWDFGVNEDRVRRWLAAIAAAANSDEAAQPTVPAPSAD